MTSECKDRPSFSQWLARPQTLIALSALLLSLCGLFISIYEASLIRKAQRASVWPHVEVTASMVQGSVRLWAQNTGVGPARVRTAAVTYDDQTLDHWLHLIRSAVGEEAEGGDVYKSMIGGRVLPADSPKELIFAITVERGAAAEVTDQLQRQIYAGAVDVTLCYCSVYDECWSSSLQDVLQRVRGLEAPGTLAVDDCDSARRSKI